MGYPQNPVKYWAHVGEATRITRERNPIYELRLAMTASPDEDVAAA